MPTIDLTFTGAAHSYGVIIRQGALAGLGEVVHGLSSAKRVVVLADANVLTLYRETLERAFRDTGIELLISAFHASESAKSLETVSVLYNELARERVERGTPVLAFGGGIAGDTAGFVAASYLRGLPFIQVPTTLLAMVDASVGGKVGVNLPLGKNLVGAFHQPLAVLIDPRVLLTLPEREYRAGIAECVKHALIADAELFEWTERHAGRILSRDLEVLEELIARNVRIKADIVTQDEREQGARALLNLGHTFAHAIEAETNYVAFLHGEAVSLGLVAAGHLGSLLGIADRSVGERTKALLSQFGLPVAASLPPADELYEAMKLDKKVQGAEIRLVIPEAIGRAIVKKGSPAETVVAAWESIRTS